MANPFVGEIRMFGGNFAPRGWLMCDGTLLPISEYDVLFTLIGTTYGGDGQSNFALPDLRSRVPIHQGNSYAMGQAGGLETVTLTTQQLPTHTHAFQAAASPVQGNDPTPTGRVPGENTVGKMYHTAAPSAPMSPKAVNSVGGSQAHDNVQPFLCINFIIATEGIFPSQS